MPTWVIASIFALCNDSKDIGGCNLWMQQCVAERTTIKNEEHYDFALEVCIEILPGHLTPKFYL